MAKNKGSKTQFLLSPRMQKTHSDTQDLMMITVLVLWLQNVVGQRALKAFKGR